jgi:hypothetical protein
MACELLNILGVDEKYYDLLKKTLNYKLNLLQTESGLTIGELDNLYDSKVESLLRYPYDNLLTDLCLFLPSSMSSCSFKNPTYSEIENKVAVCLLLQKSLFILFGETEGNFLTTLVNNSENF